MRRYFRFFFGTPQRLLATLVGAGFFVCLVNPELFERTLSRAVNSGLLALQPSVSSNVQVKAAGGLRDLDGLIKVRGLGATRCGATDRRHARRIPAP